MEALDKHKRRPTPDRLSLVSIRVLKEMLEALYPPQPGVNDWWMDRCRVVMKKLLAPLRFAGLHLGIQFSYQLFDRFVTCSCSVLRHMQIPRRKSAAGRPTDHRKRWCANNWRWLRRIYCTINLLPFAHILEVFIRLVRSMDGATRSIVCPPEKEADEADTDLWDGDKFSWMHDWSDCLTCFVC